MPAGRPGLRTGRCNSPGLPGLRQRCRHPGCLSWAWLGRWPLRSLGGLPGHRYLGQWRRRRAAVPAIDESLGRRQRPCGIRHRPDGCLCERSRQALVCVVGGPAGRPHFVFSFVRTLQANWSGELLPRHSLIFSHRQVRFQSSFLVQVHVSPSWLLRPALFPGPLQRGRRPPPKLLALGPMQRFQLQQSVSSRAFHAPS